ncbi:hypothetical protein MMC11_008941, partial [Xylographa trunciseda]|nr:hypothetical protein [Xylographa trunciseda]
MASGTTDSSTSGGMSSGMSGSFNVNNFATTLYSTAWMPTTPAAYAGSWLVLFFLALSWRGLTVALSKLDTYWARKHEGYNIVVDGGKERVDRKKAVEVWRTSVNLPRAALATVTQGIAYLLYVKAAAIGHLQNDMLTGVKDDSGHDHECRILFRGAGGLFCGRGVVQAPPCPLEPKEPDNV